MSEVVFTGLFLSWIKVHDFILCWMYSLSLSLTVCVCLGHLLSLSLVWSEWKCNKHLQGHITGPIPITAEWATFPPRTAMDPQVGHPSNTHTLNLLSLNQLWRNQLPWTFHAVSERFGSAHRWLCCVGLVFWIVLRNFQEITNIWFMKYTEVGSMIPEKCTY